jgi:hypothetical protein
VFRREGGHEQARADALQQRRGARSVLDADDVLQFRGQCFLNGRKVKLARVLIINYGGMLDKRMVPPTKNAGDIRMRALRGYTNANASAWLTG